MDNVLFPSSLQLGLGLVLGLGLGSGTSTRSILLPSSLHRQPLVTSKAHSQNPAAHTIEKITVNIAIKTAHTRPFADRLGFSTIKP